MISKQTLFIVGAGASVPYGLPTGAELRSEICDGIIRTRNLLRLLARCGHSDRNAISFAEEFLYSGQRSIDAFLARREQYRVIGLRAIAGVLLPLERVNNLYVEQGGPSPKWGRSDWLGYLWERMSDGVLEPERIAQNKISFITFNYDRSIEIFLLLSIQHTFGISVEYAWKILSKIPIFHMYGDLGGYEPGKAFRFGGEVNEDTVMCAAERLQVMPSSRPERAHDCTNLISSAVQTVFMGFGFDEMNCARLGFREVKEEDANGGFVIGTAFRTTPSERQIATDRISTSRIQLRLENESCLELLRSNASMLY